MPRESVFEKVEKYKEIFKTVADGKSDIEIKMMLCHCHYYNIGRYKNLTKEERIFRDFLLKHNLKPRSIYEKFCFLEYPEHIKKLLQENKIGVQNAQGRSRAFKRQLDVPEGKELMDEVKRIIGGLEWPALNTITEQF